MAKKNLVMGTGSGYSWYTFEPFVTSFVRNCSENADLVLFVDNISEFTRDRLSKQEGVILQNFPEDTKKLMPFNVRWKIFLDYLNEQGNDYAQIFTSDTRDVIFQGDVFKEFANYDEYFGHVTEGDNISPNAIDGGINYKWLTEIFGNDEAAKLVNKPINCCGTVIGTTNSMKIFLSKMVEYTSHTDFHGVDQGVFNYMINNNLLPLKNVIDIDCQTGAVFTSFLFGTLNPIVVRNNMILRGDGGIPAVVHQYDRFVPLVDLVDKIYRAEKFQLTEDYLDADSVSDQIPYIAFVNNFNDALKFFASHSEKINSKIQRIALIGALKKLLTINANQNPAAELLEIALQRMLANILHGDIDNFEMNKLYSYVQESLKNNRTMSTIFKNRVASYIFTFANTYFNIGFNYKAAEYLETLSALNFNADQRFPLLQTEIYRKLGRNEESLAAYKKALKLN